MSSELWRTLLTFLWSLLEEKGGERAQTHGRVFEYLSQVRLIKRMPMLLLAMSEEGKSVLREVFKESKIIGHDFFLFLLNLIFLDTLLLSQIFASLTQALPLPFVDEKSLNSLQEFFLEEED